MSTRSPVTWSAPVGRYAFEVGAHTGSFAHFASGSSETNKAQARGNAAALRAALSAEDGERQPNTPVEAVEKLEDTADAVTDRVEHADKLFKALADGQLLDPRLLTDEIGALLGLLDRLDRDGRYEEEIRVAKALHGLCVLAFRWLELVRSLRRGLAAADAVGDEAGQAWALNELGALHLCAGDPKKAGEHLERALRLYEDLGDAAGRCATRHNFDSARRDFTRPIQIKAPGRRLLTAGGSVRPLVAGVVGVAVLAVLGFTVTPIAGGGDEKQGPATEDVGRIDLTAPRTTITDAPPGRTAEWSAAFSFTANEQVEGFQCKLDGGPFAACASPTTVGPLENGKHAFAVRAIDLAGNVGDAERYEWKISANGKVAVPDIVGLRLEGGIDALADAELAWEREEAASTRPVGQIVDQSPDAGEEVRVGATVTVVVSAGIEIGVPSVLGLAEGSAIAELEQAGLLGDVVRGVSRTVPEGHVFAQEPLPGAEVRAGSIVQISVSSGSRLADLTVSIPDDGVDVSCPNGAGSCVTTVTFTVTNRGVADIGESFDVLVDADPDERSTLTLPGGLAAWASAVRTTELGPGGNCYDPDCFVRVEVDPAGSVLELNERNNIATWSRVG